MSPPPVRQVIFPRNTIMDTHELVRVHFLCLELIHMNLTSFLQDKKLTIALKGEIDHHSAKDTMRVVGNKIDLYLPVLCVLDFKDVTFMDSSGIAIVISALRRMREIQGKVRLRSVPQQAMKVFLASGIERLVEIEEGAASV